MATILVIDDNDTLREGVVAVCERMKHRALNSNSGRTGMLVLDQNNVDLVLTDLKMEGMDGLEVLREVKRRSPETAVVIMTAYGTIETAVEAMKLGAFDFVTKPFSPDVIRVKIERALEWRAVHAENERLMATTELLSLPEPRLSKSGELFEGIVGKSSVMQEIFRKISKVAASETHVHISGESGTGKELVAQAIHNLSRRSSGPLITVNCGALTESLLESELFGHEKGAFTGAIKRKLGRFELAHKGTLFLDEVGEISPSVQVKLLRVLQEQEFTRVGGEESVKVNVRVVSATNRDLRSEVDAGRFREDLFYRLHVVPIELPPLRERTDDIIPLARYFVDKLRARTNPEVRGLSAEAESRLRAYRFPGNVRELQNIIEQALVFSTPPEIGSEDLPPQVSMSAPKESWSGLPTLPLKLNDVLEELERRLIILAYEEARGVKTKTAELLDIKASALYYKLEKYGIGTVAGRELSESSPPASEPEGESSGNPA